MTHIGQEHRLQPIGHLSRFLRPFPFIGNPGAFGNILVFQYNSPNLPLVLYIINRRGRDLHRKPVIKSNFLHFPFSRLQRFLHHAPRTRRIPMHHAFVATQPGLIPTGQRMLGILGQVFPLDHVIRVKIH